MAAPSAVVAADDEEYEICNEDGFVYKRRRGLYPDVAPPSAHAAGPNPEAARRRCRHRALLRLRDKRLSELAHWEVLEGEIRAREPTPRPPTPQALPVSPCPATTALASASVLDDLLVRAEVEEAIIKKVDGLCDEVDALCRAYEEDMVQSITVLPVWGDPKELLAPDSPGTNYQNDGNGGFKGSDSGHDRTAMEAGGYDRCQEAGVSPETDQSIKACGKTMQKAPYRCKLPAGLGDDPSLSAENRIKRQIAGPSGSVSAKQLKWFCKSTSPNPVSFSSRRKSRRIEAAAAAKLCNPGFPS